MNVISINAGSARVPPVGGALLARSHSETLDPRDQAYERLPRWLQWLLTMISGLAPSHASGPDINMTRLRMYALMVVQLIVSIAFALFVSNAVLNASTSHGIILSIVGLLPAWILLAGAFRSIMTTALHDAVHLVEPIVNKKTERVYRLVLGWLGEIICIALVLPPMVFYYIEHVLNHHHDKVFLTLSDPDAAFLHKLGIRPGMTKDALWRRFRYLLFVPWSPLYVNYTLARLKAQFTAPWPRIALVIGLFGAALGVAFALGVLTPLLLAIMPALVFGIPFAALCQFTSEHNWLLVRRDASRRQYLEQTCRGRCFIDPCPRRDLPVVRRTAAWVVWWLRLLLVHLPARVLVVPWDLGPGHDMHHFGVLETIKKRDDYEPLATWMNSSYARRFYQRIATPDMPKLTTYFSLYSALDSVFDTYSQLDPADPAIEEGTATDTSGTVMSM